jgi:hypothetical protein
LVGLELKSKPVISVVEMMLTVPPYFGTPAAWVAWAVVVGGAVVGFAVGAVVGAVVEVLVAVV